MKYKQVLLLFMWHFQFPAVTAISLIFIRKLHFYLIILLNSHTFEIWWKYQWRCSKWQIYSDPALKWAPVQNTPIKQTSQKKKIPTINCIGLCSFQIATSLINSLPSNLGSLSLIYTPSIDEGRESDPLATKAVYSCDHDIIPECSHLWCEIQAQIYSS